MKKLLNSPCISVVIAAYNEERTIASVIKTAIAWGKAHEIIVVSDGSTDNTNKIITSFLPKVRFIKLTQNIGKGNALVQGVRVTSSDIVFFVDADVIGLTPENIEQLVKPVIYDEADMVIGLHNFWGFGRFRPYNNLSGQRVLRKKYILRYLSAMQQAKGGVEFIINHAFKHKRIVQIEQSNVTTLRKIDKWPFFFALWAYLHQFRDFLRAKYLIK